jgi:hypothetical protein
MVTELPEGLVDSVKTHVVSIQESKDVGGNGRGRDVDIDDRRGMDLAMVRGTVNG